MPKLTETCVRKLPQAAEGTRKVWDVELKGLVLFVGKQTKTWYFQKDLGGHTRRVLIGRYPTISAAAARETVLRLSLDMARGAGKAIQAGAPTLQAAAETYFARPKLRSERVRTEGPAQLQRHLKDWLRLPLNEISKGMVVERHASLARTPSAANHVLRTFRSIWNHARRVHDLPECPTVAIEWYPEEPDGRIIDDLLVWRATIDALENPIHACFYRLLLFTGLRRSEALTLRWRDVHADRIHIPMTKNGRSFDLPLVDAHHKLLEPLRGLGREWVFPSPKAAAGHLNAPQRLDWSPHAHRRTFATIAMEAGILEEIVGRLLNHTPISITGQRYTRPSLDALRPAMQTTCDELQQRLGR